MIKIRNTKSLWINLLLFIGIIVFVNLLSLNLYTRIDLTRGQVYTLSKVSNDLMKSLTDRLVVKAYFTKDLPPELSDVRQYTKDLLAEYRSASGGRLYFEFIDPTNEVDFTEEAKKQGISPVQVNYWENDKRVARDAFLGLVVLYHGKNDVIPVVQNTRGLEYEITSKIKKLTATNLPIVAIYENINMAEQIVKAFPFIQQDQIPQILQRMQYDTNLKEQVMAKADDMHEVKKLIGENYEIRSTDLNMPLQDDVQALIFTSATDSLEINQLFNIDQYLMSGGNILFFQDNLQVGQSVAPIKSNLLDAMEHWGIVMKDEIVLDRASAQRQNLFGAAISMPYVPIINKVNPDNPIVSSLSNLVMYFTSPIDTSAAKPGQTVQPLLWSSEQTATSSYYMFQQDIEKFNQGNMGYIGSQVLAALYSGSFDSYFSDDEAPDFADSLNHTDKGRILMVADSEFLRNNGQRGVSPNQIFALNALDAMSQNVDLIRLRSREVEFSPLDITRFVQTSDMRGIDSKTPEGASRLLEGIQEVASARKRFQAGRQVDQPCASVRAAASDGAVPIPRAAQETQEDRRDLWIRRTSYIWRS